MRVAWRVVTKRTCASQMPRYNFLMHHSKYNIWQDENGWHGSLEGYPQHEAHGESFQDLQVALWRLHQHLTGRECQPTRLSEDTSSSIDVLLVHSEDTPPPAAVFRSKGRVQIHRRARVEMLMLVMINSLSPT